MPQDHVHEMMSRFKTHVNALICVKQIETVENCFELYRCCSKFYIALSKCCNI